MRTDTEMMNLILQIAEYSGSRSSGLIRIREPILRQPKTSFKITMWSISLMIWKT